MLPVCMFLAGAWTLHCFSIIYTLNAQLLTDSATVSSYKTLLSSTHELRSPFLLQTQAVPHVTHSVKQHPASLKPGLCRFVLLVIIYKLMIVDLYGEDRSALHGHDLVGHDRSSESNNRLDPHRYCVGQATCRHGVLLSPSLTAPL